MAVAQARPRDMINAATAQARLVGLLKGRGQNTQSVDEAEDITQILQSIRQDCGSDAADAFAKALGLVESKSSH